MMRHTATTARKHLSALLDAAEAGESVFVERRGRTFRLELLGHGEAETPRKPLFTVDESLLDGQWHFDVDGSFIPGSG